MFCHDRADQGQTGPDAVPTVSSFWYGTALPPHCWLCLKSFIDRGYQFELYTYAQLDVPRGVTLRDARELLPESRVFFYRSGPGAGSVAAFANLFHQLIAPDIVTRLFDRWKRLGEVRGYSCEKICPILGRMEQRLDTTQQLGVTPGCLREIRLSLPRG